MSIAAIAWAWRQDIHSTAKFVLVALADHADDETFKCWPSLTHISAKCNLDRSTIVRSIDRLVELNKIRRTVREDRQTTVYTLLVAENNQLPETTSGAKQLVAISAEVVALSNKVVAQSDTESSRTIKEPSKKNAADDPRRAPFLTFAFSEYVERYGELIPDQSDFKALKDLLGKTKADLAELQRRWMAFLDSSKPFHREQGHPLRFFCTNWNAFNISARASPAKHIHSERCKEYGFCPEAN